MNVITKDMQEVIDVLNDAAHAAMNISNEAGRAWLDLLCCQPMDDELGKIVAEMYESMSNTDDQS